MKLEVIRTTPTLNTTIGELHMDGTFFCFALEPRDRGLTSDMSLAEIQKIKVPGQTAQPSGTFKMDWFYSPKHKVYLPRVLDVPDCEDDEFHIGNYGKDTLGCTLLGNSKIKDMIMGSKVTINEFYPLFKAAWMAGEDIKVTYSRQYSLPIQYV